MEKHASYIRCLATEYDKRISQNISWLLPLHTHPAITKKEGGAGDDSKDSQSDIELINLQAYFLPCIHVNVSCETCSWYNSHLHVFKTRKKWLPCSPNIPQYNTKLGPQEEVEKEKTKRSSIFKSRTNSQLESCPGRDNSGAHRNDRDTGTAGRGDPQRSHTTPMLNHRGRRRTCYATS